MGLDPYTPWHMRITPVDREWIHTHVLEPYLQGCELMKMAWEGVDKSLKPNYLTLSKRAICWLQGASLMIPVVNTIIWLTWQALGPPEKLFDPFCPETTPPSPSKPQLKSQIIIHEFPPSGGISKGLIKPQESTVYVEKEGDSEIQMNWKVEYFADKIVADQYCTTFWAHSTYRPNWILKEYSYRMGNKEFKMWQNQGDENHVYTHFIDEGLPLHQKTFKLDEPLPLIQHRAIGLRPFILSEQKNLFFYAIVPEVPIIDWIPGIEKPPFLMKAVAKKLGEEEVPGFPAKLVKVEVISTWKWPYNSIKSEMWFDPITGILKKFVDSGRFIDRKEGELVQSSP